MYLVGVLKLSHYQAELCLNWVMSRSSHVLVESGQSCHIFCCITAMLTTIIWELKRNHDWYIEVWLTWASIVIKSQSIHVFMYISDRHTNGIHHYISLMFNISHVPPLHPPTWWCCIALYCTVLHCTVLYCTVLYCIALYYTTLHFIVLFCTVLHCTAL